MSHDLVPIQEGSISPHIAQRASVVRSAQQALTSRRRLSESARGKARRTTAYTYTRAWADFSLFLEYRTGETLTPDRWATLSNKARTSETQALLDHLDTLIAEVDAADVQAYVEAVLAKPCKARAGKIKVGLENSTINTRLAALKHLFKVAIRMGVRQDNPAHPDMVDRRQCQRTYRQHALTSAQVRTLLASLSDDSFIVQRDRLLILLLARLGIRRDEACELRSDSFSVASDGGWQVIVHRKGDKVQTLLLPADLQQPIQAFVERWNLTEYLFPVTQAKRSVPLHPDEVTRIVRKRTEAALGAPRAPHAFRSTFITTALDAGVPLADVQAFAGHEDPATTVRYRDSELSRERSAAQFVSYAEAVIP